MSSAQKKFFIIANKIIGPKLFRTPSTVKKYQQIYQKDLTVETFLTEQEAFTRLNFLRTEHDRLLQLEDVHSNRKKEEQKDKVIHEMGKEETETKENKEKKNEFNIFYFLKENEELLKTAQQKIDPHQIYHMFFDGASKFNPGPVISI